MDVRCGEENGDSDGGGAGEGPTIAEQGQLMTGYMSAGAEKCCFRGAGCRVSAAGCELAAKSRLLRAFGVLAAALVFLARREPSARHVL